MTIEPALPAAALYTGRGTTALWALLRAIGGADRRISLPANICEIVIPAVLHAGFTPVYHDVDPVSGNATLETIRAAHGSGAPVCLATHNFGSPLDIGPIAAWARKSGVFLVEDACNALGATWNGQPVGTFGDAAIFSFGHAKIVEVGLGGALAVRDPGLRDKGRSILDGLPLLGPEHRRADAAFQAVLRALRQNPGTGTPAVYRALYDAYMPFLLFRPDADLRAAIARGVATLDENLAARREKAELWRRALGFAPLEHKPRVAGEAHWRYTVLVPAPARDMLLERLREGGVPASKWFPPVPGLFDGRRSLAACPGARQFGERCLNVFVDQNMNAHDIKAAAGIIRAALETS